MYPGESWGEPPNHETSPESMASLATCSLNVTRAVDVRDTAVFRSITPRAIGLAIIRACIFSRQALDFPVPASSGAGKKNLRPPVAKQFGSRSQWGVDMPGHLSDAHELTPSK